MKSELHFDAVVIGAGMAGLVAGTRLAQGGARVCVLAKGHGSTHLAPATIDVLGYAPHLVQEPVAAIEKLVAEHPQHPYALLGSELVGEAVGWFADTVAGGPLPGYTYVGGLERNQMLPTAVGALRPSALVPETMAAGERDQLARVCIAGTPSLRDFHPSLCAANLAAAGIEARSVSLDLKLERADMSTLGIARHFDDPTWRRQFCAELSLTLRAEEHVGLPAMLGLTDPHAVLSDLEHRLGRRVFEIPTLPPSVPGMRLYEILRAALRAAGGRLVLGGEVVGSTRDGARLTAVSTNAAGRDLSYVAPAYVLATGGFASGAIELDSRWVTHERVLDLPLRGLPADGGPRFVSTYLDEQPLARVGVAVDGDLRADGTDNVFVAGASLPGAAPWREGSGEGIALASGYKVAQMVAGRPQATQEATA
ncbi:MAG TPA: anaerobic glycerol-3-phosphate dehydrogenase subunit GlpB [Solirubrobacteraceae bacterium]|jgi:glycerol-3-phosphate dehydrogenase subunit B|nr:anaerobic glycerol-3-phosphate dehydrogenase subunit GlpB [Solirubrobacteraceae bacterium]